MYCILSENKKVAAYINNEGIEIGLKIVIFFSILLHISLLCLRMNELRSVAPADMSIFEFAELIIYRKPFHILALIQCLLLEV